MPALLVVAIVVNFFTFGAVCAGTAWVVNDLLHKQEAIENLNDIVERERRLSDRSISGLRAQVETLKKESHNAPQ